MAPERELPRVFFDTSSLIAGAYSRSGASHVLLQLAAFGLIDGRISPDVREEALRNVASKLPGSLAALRVLLREAVTEGPHVDTTQISEAKAFADPKDVPILASALAQACPYLVTLNERDFWPPADSIRIIRPGALVERLRDHIRELPPPDA